jgi:apolipoprotein N-acyltransferase
MTAVEGRTASDLESTDQPATRWYERRGVGSALSAVAGVLVAAALPPWGWWPSALVGIALLDATLAGQPPGARFWRGWCFGVGWLAPGMAWMWFLTSPGYVIAIALFSALIGLATLAVPPVGRARLVALPAALTLAEALRWRYPFGGVPLATLAMTQVSTPWAIVARIGGALALSTVTVILGCALRRAITQCWTTALIPVAVVIVVALVAVVSPRGHQIGTLRVAVVQGGGPQGTHAVKGGEAEKRAVFERHIAATALVPPGVDLVVWPENSVNVDGSFADSEERQELSALAQKLHTMLAVGVVEEPPDIQNGDRVERFLNAEVVFDAQGNEISRYDKVIRVPFGEYVPLRSLLDHFTSSTAAVPRDAVAGTGPAVLDTPKGRLAIAISWEVFFPRRVRAGVRDGGTVLINPTNGSSYTGTILQSQQVASSRLRAIESDRWVAQASPTGFSAFVSPNGSVLDRTAVSERRVITRSLGLRQGETWYIRFGDTPLVVLSAVAIVALWRRRARLLKAELTAPASP